MIISHKYKFIFVKTRKVAGSSLEIALSKHLGEDDIVTVIGEEHIREERGYKKGGYYKIPLYQIRPGDVVEWFRRLSKEVYRTYKFGVKLSLPGRPRRYLPHMSAKSIKAIVGDALWEEYYTFTIERNPWDMVVSYYYFWMRHNGEISFEEFVKSGISAAAANFPFYGDGDQVLVDHVMKYEDLDAELAALSARVGFPENVADIMKDIKAKSHLRKVRDYHEMYTDELKDIVAHQFAREIAMYGYEY